MNQLALDSSADTSPIRFWKPSDPFGFLSNFAMGYAFKDGDGTVWLSSEHYYQAHKYLPHNAPYAWLVKNAPFPKLAAQLGRSGNIQSNWDERKVGVMKWALWYKFTDSRLRPLLLATGDRDLIEASPIDDYWGEGKHGAGLNMLGVLLMQLRAKLRSEA